MQIPPKKPTLFKGVVYRRELCYFDSCTPDQILECNYHYHYQLQLCGVTCATCGCSDSTSSTRQLHELHRKDQCRPGQGHQMHQMHQITQGKGTIRTKTRWSWKEGNGTCMEASSGKFALLKRGIGFQPRASSTSP